MGIIDATYYIYNSPFGQITIGEVDGIIVDIFLGIKELSGTFRATKVTNNAQNQILEYLSGKRQTFTLPFKLNGTSFKQSVHKELTKIPYGSTITPQVLAKRIGKDNSYRRIKHVANENRLQLVIPDHRIVTEANFNDFTKEEKFRKALRTLERKNLS